VDRPNFLPDSGTPTAVSQPLWDISQAAEYLKVSESWVRRHLAELPHSRHGRLIRFDPEGLKRTVVGRKSLEPKELVMVNRFQRGMVYLRGKKKMWYGRFRLETLNAKGDREIWNCPLGLKTELPTKFKAEEKLREIMDGVLKSGISTKVKLYSTLVEEWKATEGMTLDEGSLNNYSNTLRACVLPTFANTDVRTITRKSIQDFLTKQAKKYSKSYVKSMRVTLCMTLAWAEQNGYLQQPNGWLEGIRLPRAFGGRKVVRTELLPEQTDQFVSRLKEPYSTLVLLLASVGIRGEAAIGLQPADLDAKNVLHVRRVIYGTGTHKRVIPLTDSEGREKEEIYPLDALVHVELLQRLRTLGAGAEWILHGRTGEPVDLGNARKRWLHPTAALIGVKVGGWHDFRHTLKRQMRRAKEDPVVVRDTLGHSRVEQQEVYDEARRTEVGEALRRVGLLLQSGRQLVPSVEPNPSIQ
jgi:integrase